MSEIVIVGVLVGILVLGVIAESRMVVGAVAIALVFLAWSDLARRR